MNTLLSAPRVALMALALGTAGVTATFAQTTTPSTTPVTNPPPADTTTTTGGNWHHRHHRDHVLTYAERTQLKKAHEQALASNGTLQSEQASLKQQFETLKGQGTSATHDQWTALHQQAKAFHQQMRSAELLIDPTLAPIFAKLDAAHQHHHSA